MEPEVSYRVHKSSPLIPILNQLNPDQNITYCFFKIKSNIIHPFIPRYPKRFLQVLDQNFAPIHLLHACCMSHQFHSPWFDHPSNIWRRVQIMEFFIAYLYSVTYYFLPLMFKNSLWHFALKHPQSMLFNYSERTSCILTQ